MSYVVPESGDDNLILGFGVDKVSIYEKIEVKKNDAEQQELSPYCILLCLSSDGKLIMFYVARYILLIHGGAIFWFYIDLSYHLPCHLGFQNQKFLLINIYLILSARFRILRLSLWRVV